MSEFVPFAARRLSRRALVAGLGAGGLLAACRRSPEADEPTAPETPAGPAEGSLGWAIAGPWRAADSARDAWRHPAETLEFFEIRPDATVIEFWPGAGWWTEILAPYLARGGGRLHVANFELPPAPPEGETPDEADLATAQIVARFRERFGGNRRLYGEVAMSEFGPTSGPVAPANSADLALFMQNLHNWMAAGIAEKAFADAFAALKPGGVLGVEQHRGASGGTQDPAATSGYVQEAFVKQLAAEAGFAFVAASEINANPRDTKDHPFGVWTLPPQRLTAPRGQAPDPEFDRTPYDAIGESDRMTLKFRKPAA